MPELPEVETIRRSLAPELIGTTFVSARHHPSAKFASASEAVGRAVTGVDRRGKYLLVTLDDARSLVIHLGMTGQLRIDPDGNQIDPYDRAGWSLDDGRRFALRDVRRFGRIAVVGADWSALPTLAALGPEPFDPDFTAELLWANLRRSRVRLKTQLLSQRPVAGVGNIYADEALWRARVHPAKRQLGRPGATRLHEAIREVLAQGIAHGGTTLRDYRTLDGGEGTNQMALDCYGRAGDPCRRCGDTLHRTVLDGRGTTLCRTCQRR